MSERFRGVKSQSITVLLVDVTTKAPKTGLDVTTLKLQYVHSDGASTVVSTATSLSLLATLATAFTAYGAKEIDSTNKPGEYRIDIPDGAWSPATAKEVVVTVNGTAIAPCSGQFDIVEYNFDTLMIRRGIAVAGSTTTTIVLESTASTTDNAYRGNHLKIIDGTGAGQHATILSYVGSSRTATIARLGSSAIGWSTIPDITSSYVMMIEPMSNLALWSGQLAQVDANNLPKVDTEDWKGTVLTAPGTAGTPDVNAIGDFTSAMKSSIAQAVWLQIVTGSTNAITVMSNLAGMAANVTTSSIATRVWQVLTASSDFTTVGSIGKLLVTNIDAKISTAGGGGIDVNTLVTALVQALIGTKIINLVSPLIGPTLSLVIGADYLTADGTQIVFSAGGSYPVFSGGSCLLYLDGQGLSIAGSLVTSTGSTRSVQFDIPRATSLGIKNGTQSYSVVVTLSNGDKIVPWRGRLVAVNI